MIDLKLGSQLCVDQSYRHLINGETYYYLGPWSKEVVHLLFFFQLHKYRRVGITSIPRAEFEYLINPSVGILRLCEVQLKRPSWMSGLETTNFAELEDRRRANKSRDHESRVSETLQRLSHALDSQRFILGSEKPILELARFAREAKVHPYRFQVQFFSYVIFGNDKWALLPEWHRNGRWDREEKQKKFGRSPISSNYCFNFPLTSEMRAKILHFARSKKRVFRTFSDLFAEMLRVEFGCVALQNAENPRLSSKLSQPFPSYNQAYRTIRKELTEQEYATLFGKQKRLRKEKFFNAGNFTQQFACNLEAVEADAFFINEVMQSFDSGLVSAKVIVVRIICSTTSCVVGVGFSVGGESKAAYRAALYSMVAPRKYIEKLFGLNVGTLSDWVGGGLPALFTADRGPAWSLVIEDFDRRFPLSVVAPAQEPMSKALSESSHPRTPCLDIDRAHLQTNLTAAQIIKRELIRVCADNNTSDISIRLSDSVVAAMRIENLPATPNGFWAFNQARGRNAANSSMSHEQAIRELWEPITVTLCPDGVMHLQSPYTSCDLINSGLMKSLASHQQLELKAYALPCAINFLHVEVNGILIEVKRVQRLRQQPSDYAQTEADLVMSQKNRAALRSQQRVAAVVERVGHNQISVDQVGEPLNVGSVRFGKKPIARRTNSEDQAAIRSHLRGRRS